MNVCFPVLADQGLTSTIYGHFSSAPYFLVVDTATKTTTVVANCDPLNPEAGCNPFLALTRLHLDGIVVGGIGDNTVRLMNSIGFKVLEAQTASVEESVTQFERNELAEVIACDSHLEGRCSDDEGPRTCNHTHDHEHEVDDEPVLADKAGCDPDQCNKENCALGHCS